jgi:hypothetical protein
MPLRWRIRNALAELLPRRLAFALGIRRRSPGRRWPRGLSVTVPPATDTGGAYRAKHRMQDPSKDPTEPYGGESSSTGNEHAWSGCTMSAGADAIAYQSPRGAVTPWGGDLRHRQSDMSGGTDLYDLRTAWAEYGETLTIKTGSGWSAVVKAHDEGRAIVAQGEGNVPGSETFDGAHACSIAPETHSDGRWLFGDPLASDWQWVSSSSIRSWMENLSSSCYYAVGEKPAAAPAPEPEPEPEPVKTYAQGLADGLLEGYRDGHAHGELVGDAGRADVVFRSWAPGRPWEPPSDLEGARWDLAAWGAGRYDPGASWSGVVVGGRWDEPAWAGEELDGEPWAAWPLPLDALYRAQWLAAWNGSATWAGAVWRD